MGQCYSVYLKAKLKNADDFVRLSREYFTTHEWPASRVSELTGVGEIIKYMIADRDGLYVTYEDGWPTFRGGFDSSYSWNGVMEEWFRAVAPSLAPGSEIEVWPDSGSWKCVVTEGGGVEQTEYEEADDEEVA